MPTTTMQPPHFINQVQQSHPPRAIPPPPPPPREDNCSVVSELSTYYTTTTGEHGSIMGGRNEQAHLRTNSNNNDHNTGRRISKVRTTRRLTIGSTISTRDYEPSPNTVSRNESDTNADTCCLGSNFIPIGITNRTADVFPYDSDCAPALNVPIVSGATALDHSDGNTYILIFHESLYYGTKLGHSLLKPNQI